MPHTGQGPGEEQAELDPWGVLFSQNTESIPGVGKLWPMGQVKPASLRPVHEFRMGFAFSNG